jgi:predicted secreted protein
MDLAFGLALYFMIWWMCLFAVLPFGLRTQGEADDVVPGTPASAPVKPRLKKIFVINSLVSAIVFAFVWAALEYNWAGTAMPAPPY